MLCARRSPSQRALDELNVRNADKNSPQLAARIGLESGQVVVDATGAVFGDAPNVAARVQSLAEPGAVIVTAASGRRAEDNPVRAIDVFVDELDLRGVGFEGVVAETTGRPAYHPATMLKIYVYGWRGRCLD